jgi:hypothetical protein
MRVLTTKVVPEQPQRGLKGPDTVSYRELMIGDASKQVHVERAQPHTLDNTVNVWPAQRSPR